MQKHWNIKSPDPRLQAELSDALNVHPIVAQLLINREITDIKEAKDWELEMTSAMRAKLSSEPYCPR